MKLAIPVDPAALFPSRLEQINLPLVLTGTLAQWHPKPGIKPAGMDAEQATQHSHREPLLMLGNERVLHFASLAKYAVAFFKSAGLHRAAAKPLQPDSSVP
ncbi:hypothetical protein ASG19_17575 [Rhizobium sp. Leaf306]|nr:hypothetical protein ASG19_17575 [Rhizobium sp. Leaf306]